jgi:hypothetical protein
MQLFLLIRQVKVDFLNIYSIDEMDREEARFGNTELQRQASNLKEHLNRNSTPNTSRLLIDGDSRLSNC